MASLVRDARAPLPLTGAGRVAHRWQRPNRVCDTRARLGNAALYGRRLRALHLSLPAGPADASPDCLGSTPRRRGGDPVPRAGRGRMRVQGPLARPATVDAGGRGRGRNDRWARVDISHVLGRIGRGRARRRPRVRARDTTHARGQPRDRGRVRLRVPSGDDRAGAAGTSRRASRAGRRITERA